MIFDSLLRVFATCHDDASRFVRLLAKPGRMVLEFDDLVSVVQVGVATATVTGSLVPVHLSLYVLGFGANAMGDCTVVHVTGLFRFICPCMFWGLGQML